MSFRSIPVIKPPVAALTGGGTRSVRSLIGHGFGIAIKPAKYVTKRRDVAGAPVASSADVLHRGR
jgi:hypothetical protein